MNKTERDTLIIDHIDLTQKVAWGFAKKYCLDKIEIESLCMQRLVEIASRYDPSKCRSKTFRPYLLQCLKGYCFNYMRDNSRKIRVPRQYSDIMLKKYKYIRQKGSHDMTNDQIAKAINICPKLLEEVDMATRMTFTQVRDHHIVEDNFNFRNRDALYAIANLSEENEKLLNMYYVKEASVKDIAKELKLSAKTVKRQLNELVTMIHSTIG